MLVPGVPSSCEANIFLRPQGAVPQALTRTRGARFIILAAIFSGMPTGLGEFVGVPGVSGLWLCTQTHIKKTLCPIRLFIGRRLDSYIQRQSNTFLYKYPKLLLIKLRILMC